jgi:hypothetical protein
MRFLPTRIHAIIGLVVGIALLLAPNIFGFNDVGGAAEAIPRILGILLIISELITNNGLSPVRAMSMSTHLALDVIAGAFLAISPWLFGFSDTETNAWVPHLIVGLLIMGYALVTRTVPDDEAARRTSDQSHPITH